MLNWLWKSLKNDKGAYTPDGFMICSPLEALSIELIFCSKKLVGMGYNVVGGMGYNVVGSKILGF